MSDYSISPNSEGIGFVGLLTVLFIGLKLTGHIAWSWWWVLSPVWISAAITIGILVAVLLFLLVGSSITALMAAIAAKRLK